MENNTSRNSTCPAWCVTQHTDREPGGGHYCEGERLNLDIAIDRTIGDGVADVHINRSLVNGEPRFYVDLTIQADIQPDEIASLTRDLENMAQAIRDFAQTVGTSNG